MSIDLLSSSFQLGPTELKNRVVMAPMTRCRSLGNVPNALVASYYAQRSEAGLIITEGTSPSPNGLGYARIPGLFSAEQVAGWKLVADAVHAEGAAIFAQLMHTGRMSHENNLPAGARVLAPSAIAHDGKMWVDGSGDLPCSTPHEMSEQDIEDAIEEYVQAAANARAAGLDGIELHGANGYLIEQFLNVASNKRSDKWGGDIQGRMRFAVEVAKATSAKIGADRVGIRLSPYGALGGMQTDPQTDALYVALTRALSEIGLVYLHLVDHSAMGAPTPKPELVAEMKANFKGAVILSGGYDAKRAQSDLEAEQGDLVAFGRPFISTPRLVTAFKNGTKQGELDMSTFYTPGEKGYTDYPLS